MQQATDQQAKINEGWEKIKNNAITKLENYLTTGNADVMFTKKEWMDYYTYALLNNFFSRIVYNLSTMKQENIQQMLYNRYTESITNYLMQRVLPEL